MNLLFFLDCKIFSESVSIFMRAIFKPKMTPVNIHGPLPTQELNIIVFITCLFFDPKKVGLGTEIEYVAAWEPR